jgi:hypothetical protein
MYVKAHHVDAKLQFLFPSLDLLLICLTAIAQSVQRLATGWTDRGSNPGGGEIFRTCPYWPWGPTQPPVQWVPGLSRV